MSQKHYLEYDLVTRALHAGIAVAVLVQLTSSQFMDVPKPGRVVSPLELASFSVHEWSGMTVFILILLHWLYGASGHAAGGWGHLFPWFSKSRLRTLWSGVKAAPSWIRSGTSDGSDEYLAPAGAVHGLGLLAVTAMAVTGAVIFAAMGPDGRMSHFAREVKEIHEFFASFVWVYLFGHVGMAALHQWQGDRVLTRMFNLFRG